MANTQGPEAYAGKTAVDAEGAKIGSVGQVYLNDETGQPDWITVNTGMFGTKEHFAPLYGSSFDGDRLVLPYGKDVVKDAPDVADAAHLDGDEQQSLYAYYDQYMGAGTGYHTETTGGEAKAKGTGNAEGYVTRSEEQLRVGTQRVAAGRAGIRKFVVTEQQTVTVPVSHDEVRVVREPMQPGDSVDGSTIGEDSIDVALMQDEVRVDKQVVGVEKVRLATETVTEQQEVSEAVRKEQIEVTGETTGTVPTQTAKRKK